MMRLAKVTWHHGNSLGGQCNIFVSGLAKLFQIALTNLSEFCVVAPIFEVRKRPFEGLILPVSIAGDEVGVDAVAEIDLLSQPLRTGEDDFVVVEIADIEIHTASLRCGETVFDRIALKLGCREVSRRTKLGESNEAAQ